MLTEYKKLLSPNKVHLPLTDSFYKIATAVVKAGEKVLRGQIIAYKENDLNKTPIFSTVSGTVVEFKQMRDRYNKIVDHIIIENDKQNEDVDYKTFEGDVPSSVVISQLRKHGIYSLDVDGIYTSLEFDSSINKVFVNIINVNEPFISTDYSYLLEYAKEVADGIKLLGQGEKDIHIILDKYMPAEPKEALIENLGDFDYKLILVNSSKVSGYDYLEIKKIVKEKITHNLHDNGVIYVTAETCKVVSDVLRKGHAPFERHLLVTGDGVKDNAEFEVTVGTPLYYVVEDLGGYQDIENMNVHVGDYLTGVQLSDDTFSITETVDAIDLSEFHEEPEEICIKCGECNDVCPAGILPQNIMDAELRELNGRIVDLHTDECIECGLCSYVCPSKINVLEWVRRAKRRTN